MTQSGPIEAPSPMVTFGYTTVPSPIVTPDPIDTKAPMATPAPSCTSPATAAIACTPASGRDSGANSRTARANARYGCGVLRHAECGGVGPSPRITADARVDVSSFSYLALARNV